jgi:ParB family chromosome partitioning protein
MSNMFAKPSGRPTDSALKDAMKDNVSSRASATEVIEIHKDFLRPDPTQPRKHFPQEVLERRRQQLEEDGQYESITVFPGVRGDDGNLYYDILDGECRWRSILPSDKIEYLRAEIDTTTDREDKTAIRLSQLMHNDDGSEPLTPLERAYAYREIVDDLKAKGVESPNGTAARKLGLSQAVFSEVLSLASLPDELGTFALEKGITDAKVLNGMVQVHKRGRPEDVAELQATITASIEQGESLRKSVKGVVDKVKARKPKKNAVPGVKQKEKPSRLLTAREIGVKLKDDGAGILTIETPRETIRINVTREQLENVQTSAEAAES